MKNILSVYIFTLLFAFCQSGHAMDYMPATGAGGITFKNSQDISLEKETVSISKDKVRVEYKFMNTTDHPIRERVYFAMPFYDGACDNYSGSLKDFKLWADDRQVNTVETVSAWISGRDVTSILKQHGMSDDEIANFTDLRNGPPGCNRQQPGDEPNELPALFGKWNWEQLHAIGINEMWSVQHVYYWDQVFPPGRLIDIVHEYVPVVGFESVPFRFHGDEPTIKSAADLSWYIEGNGNESLCIDNGTFKAARKEEQETLNLHSGYTGMHYAVVHYVVNWPSPIKDFTLDLKKQYSKEVVSLCFDGKFNRTGPLDLSANMLNFVPSRDISVVFLYTD